VKPDWEYDPVGHALHDEIPAELVYVPAWHDTQVMEEEAPAVLEKSPALHCEQVVAPPGMTMPNRRIC
jgi:hypothetical protein